ncbi:MAG: ThuA domain-containing protein [Bacteroidota bacterium]
MRYTTPMLILSLIFLLSCTPGKEKNNQEDQKDTPNKLRALIIDGQNNHGVWPKTTVMMKDFLEETNLFEVDIERTAFTWQGPHCDPSLGGEENRKQLIAQYPIEGGKKTEMTEEPQADPNFSPDFSKYDVVISNLGWKASTWPEQTKADFETFVAEGGGFVVIHAANNSFGDWDAYNEMIGLGGWGGRGQHSGPYVYVNDKDEVVRDEGEGECGSHGLQHEYQITIQDTEHPITKGLPKKWLHTKDELYDRLRGPAKNMTVLATAYSDIEKNASNFSPLKGTNRHEPMLLTIDYGEGRVFHTVMGHTDYSFECVGFITTFIRGTEWAASGKVTLTEIPTDFPTADKSSQRKWK